MSRKCLETWKLYSRTFVRRMQIEGQNGGQKRKQRGVNISAYLIG